MIQPDPRKIEFTVAGGKKLIPTGDLRPPCLGEWYWHTGLDGPRRILYIGPDGQPRFDAIILKEVDQ